MSGSDCTVPRKIASQREFPLSSSRLPDNIHLTAAEYNCQPGLRVCPGFVGFALPGPPLGRREGQFRLSAGSQSPLSTATCGTFPDLPPRVLESVATSGSPTRLGKDSAAILPSVAPKVLTPERLHRVHTCMNIDDGDDPKIRRHGSKWKCGLGWV